jgi:hypothetical protein
MKIAPRVPLLPRRDAESGVYLQRRWSEGPSVLHSLRIYRVFNLYNEQ